MGSKPQDLSLACSFLFCLLLLFPFLTSTPPPLPLPDDHEQLPSRRLHDGDYDDDDDRRRPKKKRRVGDHFNPDNDELMDHYLKKKIQGIDVSIKGSPRLIYSTTIQNNYLLSAVKSEKWYWYFFYRLKNYGKRTSTGEFGKIRKLKSEKGKWKPTGKDHQVLSEKTNQRIGITKCLTYIPSFKPKAKGNHSEWTIHEYHLLPHVPNPEQYVIVKLIRKGVMPANLSPAENGEGINLPAKVKRRLTSSIAAVGCEDHSLAASPSNEKSSQSFVVVDKQGSSKATSTSSCVVDNPHTELEGSINNHQPIHYTHQFQIDPSPLTPAEIKPADWEMLREIFGIEPSPQSRKPFEQIPQPSQGWDNARHSPQLNHKI